MLIGKDGKASTKANSEAFGAVEAKLLTRKTIQVTPVAQEGKRRAKTGHNSQTYNTSDESDSKSGKTSKNIPLGNTPNAA